MEIIKKNLFVVIITILIGTIFSLHHLLGFWMFGENYQPFSVNTTLAYLEEETYIYAAHINHLLSGYLIGDPYVWEYRISPSPFLSEVASVFPIFIIATLTQSISFAFASADFVFPAILFLTIYLCLRKLDFDKNFCIAAASGVMITPFLSMVLPKIQSYGTYLTGASEHSLFFSRTPHPQVSSIYFFASLLLTVLIFKRPVSRFIYLWAVATGLTIYASPFVGSTTAIAQLSILPFLIKRIGLNRLLLPLALILLIVSPYLINLYQLQTLFKESDFLLRTSFEKHFLFPMQLRYIAIGLLLMLIRIDNLSKILFLYILMAAILIDGHQLIFGRNIEADHWFSRVLAPVSTLALFVILYSIVQVRLKLKYVKVFWLVIISAVLLVGTYTQFSWIDKNQIHINKDNQLLLIMTTINEQTPKDSVIGSLSPTFNKYLTGLTGRKTYIAPGDRTLVSSDEQIERICDLIFLSQKSEKVVDRKLINYAFGFEAWFKNDVTYIQESIKTCLAQNEAIPPKYKLDFILEEDIVTRNWNLKRINGEII